MSNVAPVRPLAHPIPDSCRIVGCGRTHMYALIASGAVVAKKLGRRTVITDASLQALIANAPALGARGR